MQSATIFSGAGVFQTFALFASRWFRPSCQKSVIWRSLWSRAGAPKGALTVISVWAIGTDLRALSDVVRGTSAKLAQFCASPCQARGAWLRNCPRAVPR